MNRILIILLASVLPLFVSPFQPVAAEQETTRRIGLVTFRVGDAEIKRGDRIQKIRVRELVEEKDVIRTGKNSRVVVQFSKGAFISVQENSEVVVKNIQHTQSRLDFFINIISGNLGVDAQKNGSQKYNIQIQGPTAVALVRGTTFIVEAEGQTTRILVGEGEVEVQGPGAANLLVKAGERALAEMGPNKSIGIEKNLMDDFEASRLKMLEEFRASKARNFDHLIDQVERNKNLMPR
ncbi:MAG: FecR family protein [Leptospiraceae bacterium]